jgi:hypothetical protein
MVSNPILELLRRLNNSVAVVNPISHRETSSKSAVFADDLDILIAGLGREVDEKLMMMAKRIAQAVQDGLSLHGGTLNPEKSAWVPVSWSTKGTPVNPHGTKEDAEEIASIGIQINNEGANIPGAPPSKAQKGLGVLLCADGGTAEQHRLSMSKSKGYSTRLG